MEAVVFSKVSSHHIMTRTLCCASTIALDSRCVLWYTEIWTYLSTSHVAPTIRRGRITEDGMLVLSRNIEQTIMIGDDIEIDVLADDRCPPRTVHDLVVGKTHTADKPEHGMCHNAERLVDRGAVGAGPQNEHHAAST